MAPRTKRNPAPPPEAHRFASLQDCDTFPNQCIAHTQGPEKPRCTISLIDKEDRKRALHIRRLAESLPVGSERDDSISQFILLHCCAKWHRDKLERDGTGCLDELIKMYGADISMPEPTCAHSASDRTVPNVQAACVAAMVNSATGAVSDHSLLDRTAVLTPVAQSLTPSPVARLKELDYFVPYRASAADSVYKYLCWDIPRYYVEIGELYSFTCPDYAGFVKIGFGKTAEARLRSWQLCEPGASLSKSVTVNYPQRIEQLIHLQLAQHRFKIPKCKASDCGRTHIEWFKLATTEVNQTMMDWVELTIRAPLYGADRKLEAKWIDRVKHLTGDITARRLLDILDAEAALELCADRVEQKKALVGTEISGIQDRWTKEELTQIAGDLDWDEHDDTIVETLMQQLEGISLGEKQGSNDPGPVHIDSKISNVTQPSIAPEPIDNSSVIPAATMLEDSTGASPASKREDEVAELFGSLAIWVAQQDASKAPQTTAIDQGSSAAQRLNSALPSIIRT